jgi:hypothetical protein
MVVGANYSSVSGTEALTYFCLHLFTLLCRVVVITLHLSYAKIAIPT